MKTVKQLLLSILLITGLCVISFGQNIVLTQSNESGIYKKGEQIQVSVFLNEIKSDSITVKTRENYSDRISTQKMKYSGEPIVVYSGSFQKPTSLIFDVIVDKNTASTGLVVNPEHFQPGTSRPKDFEKFWKAEKKALRALQMEVKNTPVNDIEPGFSCSDIEINCTGPKPACGYFAKPLEAKPKSLPIVLFVRRPE